MRDRRLLLLPVLGLILGGVAAWAPRQAPNRPAPAAGPADFTELYDQVAARLGEHSLRDADPDALDALRELTQ